MVTVTDTIVDAAQGPLLGVSVKIDLVTPDQSPGFVPATSKTVNFVKALTTNAAGVWSADLVPNGLLIPYGSFYQITYSIKGQAAQSFNIVVPTAGSNLWVGALLTTVEAPDQVVAGGTIIASMTYGTTITLTTKNAWTALPNLSITFTPRGRSVMVGYSCGYVVGASATQFFMDVYDVTASPARVDAAGDTITRSLTTAGQDIYQEAGPFTLSAGQKTFQMYGFIPSGGPDVSLITGTPIAFTQSFSRHRMWVREV